MPVISPPEKQSRQKAESSQPVEITESCGNIFADLGFPDAEEVENKGLLSLQIEQAITQKGLSIPAAAQQVGVTVETLFDMVGRRFNQFTIEQLSRVLDTLNRSDP